MVYYLPIVGAMALAASSVLERFVLKKRRVDIKLFQTSVFLALVVAMIPLLLFFWKFDVQALQLKNIIILILVIVFSLFANFLFFYSLKWEKITNLEPARVTEPLFVILLALIFSFFVEGLYDANSKVIIPAIVAGLALTASHIRRHHLSFNKYFIAAIFGSFLFALELVLSRLILDFYSPISFYFIRSSFIFLISFLVFKPKFSKLTTNVKWEIFAIGVLWMLFRVIVYYGYLSVGVIFTTLIIMLGPIFIYILAYFFLKEKIGWRNFFAAIIIVAAVVYAIL